MDELKKFQQNRSLIGSLWRYYRSYPLLDLAYRYIKEKRYTEAESELIKVLSVEDNFLIARWQLVLLYINTNDIENAHQQIMALLVQAPQFSIGYVALGNIQQARSEYHQAAESYLEALQTGNLLPQDFHGTTEKLLTAALLMKNPQHALTLIQNLPSNTKWSDKDKLIRAEIFKNADDLEAAHQEWLELQKLSTSPETKRTALLRDAIASSQAGDNQYAFDILHNAHKQGLFSGEDVQTSDLRTFQRLHVATALSSGNLDGLMEDLQQQDKQYLSVANRVRLAYALAKVGQSLEGVQVLLNSQNQMLAMRDIPTAHAENYYLALIDTALKAGDDGLALDAARSLVKLDPGPDTALLLCRIALNNDWEDTAILPLIRVWSQTGRTNRQKRPAKWSVILQQMADLAIKAHDFSFAKIVLQEANDLVPSAQTQAKLGSVLLSLGQTEAALQILLKSYKEAPPLSPASHQWHRELQLNLVKAYSITGNPEAAWTHAKELWSENKDPRDIVPIFIALKTTDTTNSNQMLWLTLVGTTGKPSLSKAGYVLQIARIMKSSGENANAFMTYELANKIWSIPEASLETAYLALDLGNGYEALKLSNNLQGLSAYKSAVEAIQCEAYAVIGNKQAALKCTLKRANEDPSSYHLQALAASLAKETHNTVLALEYYRRAFALKPTGSLAREIGFIHEQKQELGEAILWYRRAFINFKDQVSGLQLAFIYINKSKWLEAQSYLKSIQVTDLSSPQKSSYFEARARLILKLRANDPDQSAVLAAALADMKRSRDIFSRQSNRFSVVNLMYLQGDLDQAEAEYEQLPKSDYHNPEVLNLGGFIAKSRSDLPNAITRFKTSLTIDPDQPLITENLAYTYLEAADNPNAAKLFRQRLSELPRNPTDPSVEEKRERFQRQLRILEIPFSFVANSGLSPSRQNEFSSGEAFAIPSSSPFGSVELSWRPPIIGFRDGRVFEVFGRTQWANRRGSFKPDPNSVQGIVGIRYKPLQKQNLKFGMERFMKVGDLTENNWLMHAMWSYTQGHDFLPLVDPETQEIISGLPYVNVYLELGKFLQNERAALFYGDGRLGYTFRLNRNNLLSIFAYSIANGSWTSQDTGFAAEAGAGFSYKLRGLENTYYGDLLNLEIYGRFGHEVYTKNGDRNDRILVGVTTTF
ncbi:NfrA family protein [Flexibacterium corallicola]|uniref:NfrA family protein n=1 Tax=Flexibacterium corallicola TaxID=3037259 RepID=UPI00286F13A7|nr:hypothetical protein [Pseudovibrio sp. M1P-2-3]